MRRACVLFALAWLSCAGAVRAADADGELRQRVKRFYVLNYLDRYDEMWNLFTEELQQRLGGDKREYVRQSRDLGFELYSSRLDSVELHGSAAVVEVSLEVVLPGSVSMKVRRHRMLWKLADSGWRYAGSLDITHEQPGQTSDVRTAELSALPAVAAPEVDAEGQLLPSAPLARPEVQGSSPAAKPPAGPRWDLTAIPPPGQAPSAEAPASQAPSAEARPLQPSPDVSPAPPGSVPSPNPVPQPVASATSPPPELALLVRQAMHGTPPRRFRALEKLQANSNRELAPLLVESLAQEAPVATAMAFLEILSHVGDASDTPAALARLSDPEHAIRAAAWRAIGALAPRTLAPKLVTRMTSESMGRVQGEAARALGSVGGEVAEQAIAALLSREDADGLALAGAADAAGTLRLVIADVALVRLIGQVREGDAAAAAIRAGGLLATANCVSALEAAASKGGVLATEIGSVDRGLLALQALATAGAESAGARLGAAMLQLNDRATALDVELVASTGELEPLLDLLGHPWPGVRQRAASCVGRVVDSPESVTMALGAVERAFASEGNERTLLALQDARHRLQALAQGAAVKNESSVSP